MARSAVSNRFKLRDMGTCLSFDGVDDVVTFPHHASLNITDTITMMAWIKPTSFGENNLGVIISKGTGGFSTGYGFQLSNNTGQKTIRFASTNTSNLATSNIIKLGIWQHVAVTYDKNAGSNQVKFYMNGVAAGVATRTAANTTDGNDLYLGNSATGDRTFSGRLDEGKIFNTALTPTQILNEYLRGTSDATGLVLYTKFDEGSGTTAIDSSGTQANGTITGATYSTDVALKPRTAVSNRFLVRDMGTCLYNDGVNGNYCLLNNPASALANNAPQTIMMWLNIAQKKSAVFFSYENAGSSSQIGGAISDTTIFVGKWGGASLVSTTLPSLNTWHHFAYVFDGTNHFMYLNGSQVATSTTAPQTAVPNKFVVFDYSGANQAFRGFMDEVSIFNRVVTPTEISNHCFNGYISSTSRILYWKFDEGSGTSLVDSSGTQANGTIINSIYSTNVAFKPRTAV